MQWMDVVFLTVAAVLVNHLGLIDAIEKVARRELPIINCSRCLTFWSVLVWLCFNTVAFTRHIPVILAASSIAAFLAPWLELLFGLIGKLYEKIYEKTFPQADTIKAHPCDTDTEDSTPAVP